jgi:hypothetical protein
MVIVPPTGEPLKDTLYWEYCRILFGFMKDQNPATLMFLYQLVGYLTKVMLNDVLKVGEVLGS